MSANHVIVKVTTQHPAWPLLRQTPNGLGVWGRYRFVVNEPVEACDYWVVCDGLQTDEWTVCPPDNTIFVTWEPPAGVRPPYARRFTEQFGSVLTCHPSLRHSAVRRGQQGHPWFVGKSYDELASHDLPAKSVPLVVISSDKAFAPGHRSRLDFALAVKEHFGADAQLVGRGIASFADKWDVLAPALYSLAIENAVYDDWMTEKLPDCFLAGAFPIYHGAPNASSYFAPDSFLQIDIRDVAASLTSIERLLSDGQHYERAHHALVQARDTYLEELQLFPMLAKLLDKIGERSTVTQPGRTILRPERLIEGVGVKLRRKLSRQ